jgi:hypothetical protein
LHKKNKKISGGESKGNQHNAYSIPNTTNNSNNSNNSYNDKGTCKPTCATAITRAPHQKVKAIFQVQKLKITAPKIAETESPGARHFNGRH